MIEAKIDNSEDRNVTIKMEAKNTGDIPAFIHLLADYQCITTEVLEDIAKHVSSDVAEQDHSRAFIAGAFITGLLQTMFDDDVNKIMEFIDSYIVKYLEVA